MSGPTPADVDTAVLLLLLLLLLLLPSQPPTLLRLVPLTSRS
jgi:hypothetical protein